MNAAPQMPPLILAPDSLNALSSLRGLWAARMRQSKARNTYREANPRHLTGYTATGRWEYLVSWKMHQRVVDQGSRLLKDLKQHRQENNIAVSKAKAKAKPKGAPQPPPRPGI